MGYKERLQENNAELQSILDTVNELPEAGESGEESEFGESYWVENLNGRASCSNLFTDWKSEKVPFFDTSKSTSFQTMFSESDIVECPPYDTSSGTAFFNMFGNAKKLKIVPLLNCVNGTRLDSMFTGCSSIESIAIENTGKSTTFNYFASNCTNLKSVATLDFSSATGVAGVFNSCRVLEDVEIVNGSIKVSIKFDNSPNLSDASIQNIVDGLADLTGQTAQTVTFHSTVKAKLTDEQKTQITSKNWILA